jgi:inositol oxygenase
LPLNAPQLPLASRRRTIARISRCAMDDFRSRPRPEPRRFRDFASEASPRVRALYTDNHARQTLDFVRAKHAEYLPLRHGRMSVWDAFERLDEIRDESDPDTELSQRSHALQTAERLRALNAAPWLVLTGLVHDLGKVLCLFGEPQWAVVGDTFPVGCPFSDAVVHAELFAANPDRSDSRYATEHGIYAPACGLDALVMAWGHDEYLFHVLGRYLPAPAQWIIRYHSFYAVHDAGAYTEFLAPDDDEKIDWLRRFSHSDLYSKGDAPPDAGALRGYYQRLVADFLPHELDW